jgi:hypothetical protein
MAFTGTGRKLVGRDGVVYGGTPGTEVTGNGALAMPVGLHLVTAVKSTGSGYPASIGGAGAGVGIQPGRLIRVRTGQTITPTSDDKYIPLTLVKECSLTSFTMPFSAAEVDTTTSCDDIMTFEPGMVDMQGTMEGIVTIGSSTGPDSFLNRFIDVVQQDGITSYDVYEQSAKIYFGYFQINKNTAKGDELAVFAPINIFGMSLGGGLSDAQSFSSNFRIASYDGILPAAYRFAL